jgi:hypothetical protein
MDGFLQTRSRRGSEIGKIRIAVGRKIKRPSER